MTDNPQISGLDPFFRGAARALRPIPQLAALLAGLAAVAYCIGWVRARAYFEEFGAAWIMDGIPTTGVVRYGLGPAATIYFGLGVLLPWLAEGGPSWLRRVRRMHFLFLFGGAGMAILGGVLSSWAADLASPLLQLSYVPMTLGVAMLCAEIFYSFSDGDSPDPAWLVLSLTLLLLFGGWQIPRTMGKADALRAMTSTSQLPKANLQSDRDQEWRLLTVQGEMAFLVRLDSSQKPQAIRVVALTKLEEVTPAERK